MGRRRRVDKHTERKEAEGPFLLLDVAAGGACVPEGKKKKKKGVIEHGPILKMKRLVSSCKYMWPRPSRTVHTPTDSLKGREAAVQSNYYSGEEKRIAQGEEEAKKRAMGALGAAQREREREEEQWWKSGLSRLGIQCGKETKWWIATAASSRPAGRTSQAVRIGCCCCYYLLLPGCYRGI